MLREEELMKLKIMAKDLVESRPDHDPLFIVEDTSIEFERLKEEHLKDK